MISTRLHGAIDYGVSAALGGLSSLRALPPPVRDALRVAGVYHASYATLTRYEGGLRGALAMRQHLMLDAVGAGALCGAGLMMRRQPWAARALLVGVGLAELAVVAYSSAEPARIPGQGGGPFNRLLGVPDPGGVGYPPLDTPKAVAPDVFVVDSTQPNLLGRVLPVRMTVLRLPDGDLLLYSPTRFSHRLKHELERRGRIRHLIAPSFAHWKFLAAWQRHCPDATTWAAPGLRERSQVRRSGVRLDADLRGEAPPEWGEGIRLVIVPGGMGFNEVALFHVPTRTLLLADLVMNLEARKVPALLRPVLRLLGVTAPQGMPPPYLRGTVRLRREEAARAAERLLAMEPVRVIFAHGRWFEHDGTAALRHALRWLVA